MHAVFTGPFSTGQVSIEGKSRNLLLPDLQIVLFCILIFLADLLVPGCDAAMKGTLVE
jgi:hypothetical protein